MKLISCHIENFGKLCNFDYDFDTDKNVILKDNGWGKSTFAAFIRIMFYGFDNQTKRDEFENERKRFKPWNGGIYGGNLTFRLDNKKYIINRTFGEKEREDTFSLKNADTLIDSSDYTKNIGEEIFHINHESFKNTIFVGQDACETKSTRDIESLLGNVNLENFDVNNYDKAMNTLNSLINGLSPDRKTGKLNKISRQLDNLEFENLTLNGNKTRVAKLVERSKSLEMYLHKERAKKEKMQNRIFIELDNKNKECKLKENEDKKLSTSFDKFEPFGKTSIVGLIILFFGFFLTVLGVFLQNNGNYQNFAYPITIIGIIIMIYYVSITFFKNRGNEEENDVKEKNDEYDPFKEPENAEFANAPNKYEEYVRQYKLSEKKIDEYTGELYRINKEIEELNQEIEKQEDNIVISNKLKNDYKELKIKYDYIVKTKYFLSAAKEQFGSRYNEPVKENFDKYLTIMIDSTDDFCLNVNNELTIKDAGNLRDIRMLSKAYRDVIGLSLRLAFIESSFKVEKPFIILDDPFVNVDDNTLAPCLNMLNIISKDYQLIYFTCSISRT